jgi:hypothetical protein
LISIIKTIHELSFDSDSFRAAMEGLAIPDHIKTKLGLITDNNIDEKDKSRIRKK